MTGVYVTPQLYNDVERIGTSYLNGNILSAVHSIAAHPLAPLVSVLVFSWLLETVPEKKSLTAALYIQRMSAHLPLEDDDDDD